MVCVSVIIDAKTTRAFCTHITERVRRDTQLPRVQGGADLSSSISRFVSDALPNWNAVTVEGYPKILAANVVCELILQGGI